MNRSKCCVFDWFRQKGWKPFDFQKETWQAYRDGESGLVHAPTGVGKTYAVWMGPILDWLREPPVVLTGKKPSAPIRVLWLTPLRALAGDTLESLLAPVADLGLPWSVELRTGDTSASARKRQREKLPTALVTTPESLSLLLSYPESREAFSTLRCVVVDEWHELLGGKRGVQVELCLARLRRWRPDLRVWGLSATLGNLEEAAEVLVGKPGGRLIHGSQRKKIVVETLLPDKTAVSPWGGPFGLKLLPQVLDRIESARTTLIFTNTRAQAEIWYQAILEARLDWAGLLAVHHGSLDREIRTWVEEQLRRGKLLCTVCTSSMDLGVDFAPVDQILQVGSPKGVARLIQRAGRSGHQPGAVSRIVCVPTNPFEVLEFSAARQAMQNRAVESRRPLEQPLDLLAQHLVTVALGGGFERIAMRDEVRSAHAFRHLSEEDWRWVLEFVMHGGGTLKAYSQYCKVAEEDGLCRVTSKDIARLHRMSIGTIVSESTLSVCLLSGKNLGTIEESFVAKLRPDDHFLFAGRVLQMVHIHDMKVYVRPSKASRRQVPRWSGGHMSLSSSLSSAVQEKLALARENRYEEKEMRSVRGLLELQRRWSRIPTPEELLIEKIELSDGHRFYVYPFAGRLVHEGLGAVAAYRLTQGAPRTVSVVSNDYGFELYSPTPMVLDEVAWRGLFSPDNLQRDIRACLNAAEMAKRHFRQIARIAGLVFSGYPGQPKTTRQIQASSSLIFDVFVRYDPENRLLAQAYREVMEKEMELHRMQGCLEQIARRRIVLQSPENLTPLAFPIWTERMRTEFSSESWTDRVDRMVMRLEKAASPREKTKDRVVHRNPPRNPATVA